MELMVAMFILAILAGLGVYVVQNINNDAGAPRGAVTLQQALMVAKQNALRSQVPCGVRLTIPAGSTFVTDLQYIQQPDDFTAQLILAAGATGPPFRSVYSSPGLTLDFVDLDPNTTSYSDFSGNVQPGDYLVVNDGVPHRILNVVSGTRLQLGFIDPITNLPVASPLPVTLPLTSNYRIIRAPRQTNEDPIQLPLNIAVDVSTNTTNTNNSATWVAQPLPGQTTGVIDIVFSPSGAVVGNNVPAVDALYLWVRDTGLPLFQGDNTIVAVYTRTGLVAAHPVDQTAGGDPYSFAKDGRASGN
jgi:hypothetical protein